MLRKLHFALPSVAVTVGLALPAQEQASTFSALAQDSDAVAELKVLAVDRSDPSQIQVTLRRLRSLTGDAPQTLQLSEPGWRSCGRALHGVVPGTSYLAFLRQVESEWRLTVSGARALVLRTPAVVHHVEELVEPRTAAAELDFLLTSMTSTHPRINQDATQALALHPALTQIDGPGRQHLHAALTGALKSKSTDLVPLLTATSRLGGAEPFATLVDHYLSDDSSELDRILQQRIASYPIDRRSERIVAALERNQTSNRSFGLIAALERQDSRGYLLKVLQSGPQQLRLEAAQHLIHLGLSDQEVAARSNSATAQRARQRIDRARRPRFRAIFGDRR